jgi:hypothetical protein
MAERRLSAAFGWRSPSGTATARAEVVLPCLFSRPSNSEAEVAEGLVGFGHTVHFVTLLHGAATAFRGVEQLVGQALGMDFSPRLRASPSASAWTGPSARRTHFDGHLVVGTTDAARLHFDRRSGVVQSLLNQFDGVGAAVLLMITLMSAVRSFRRRTSCRSA